jgi:3-oxoadipate enol-lactonase
VAINQAGLLEPIADATRPLVHGRLPESACPLEEIRDSIVGCTPMGYNRLRAGDRISICRLGSVKTPALVVCGTDDPSAAPGESRHVASLFPNGAYDDFPGAKHLPNVEQPDAFNRVLLKWLGRAQMMKQ